MGMVRIYTYVGTYTYAYVPMQCVMLSRLYYRVVGRQYCTYSYIRERERERRKYYYYYQQHKVHTLVGVFTIIWEIHSQRLSPKPTYAIPRKSPREFPTRTQTRRFVSSFKLHCKSVYLSPMWIQVGSTLLIRVLIKSKLQTTRKKYHQDDEFRIMCPF